MRKAELQNNGVLPLIPVQRFLPLAKLGGRVTVSAKDFWKFYNSV